MALGTNSAVKPGSGKSVGESDAITILDQIRRQVKCDLTAFQGQAFAPYLIYALRRFWVRTAPSRGGQISILSLRHNKCKFGDLPYLTAESAVLHCALDASKERREKRKKPFSAFSAQSSAAGLPAQPGFPSAEQQRWTATGLWHWVCSAVKGNGVEKPAFELVGNHQMQMALLWRQGWYGRPRRALGARDVCRLT